MNDPAGWRAITREHLHNLAVGHDDLIAGMVKIIDGGHTADDCRRLMQEAVLYQAAATNLLQLAYAVGSAAINEAPDDHKPRPRPEAGTTLQ